MSTAWDDEGTEEGGGDAYELPEGLEGNLDDDDLGAELDDDEIEED